MFAVRSSGTGLEPGFDSAFVVYNNAIASMKAIASVIGNSAERNLSTATFILPVPSLTKRRADPASHNLAAYFITRVARQ